MNEYISEVTSIDGYTCLQMVKERRFHVDKNGASHGGGQQKTKQMVFPTVPIELFMSTGYGCLKGHTPTILPSNRSKSKG